MLVLAGKSLRFDFVKDGFTADFVRIDFFLLMR